MLRPEPEIGHESLRFLGVPSVVSTEREGEGRCVQRLVIRFASFEPTSYSLNIWVSPLANKSKTTREFKLDFHPDRWPHRSDRRRLILHLVAEGGLLQTYLFRILFVYVLA